MFSIVLDCIWEKSEKLKPLDADTHPLLKALSYFSYSLPLCKVWDFILSYIFSVTKVIHFGLLCNNSRTRKTSFAKIVGIIFIILFYSYASACRLAATYGYTTVSFIYIYFF